MPKTDWKKAERRVAGILGGKRVPITGRTRGSTPDVEHSWLSIEVKHWAKLPGWILDALAQAEASVRGNQLPVAILHEKGKRYDDSLIVMRLSEFKEWFGDRDLSPVAGVTTENQLALESVGKG